jgi:hypothetical protein
MAFSEANLKPFVRVCSSLTREPHPYSAFWRFRSHFWRIFGYTEVAQKRGLGRLTLMSAKRTSGPE